jgi:chromosome partitioning protein
MQTIVFTGRKGGCTKTTSAINVAAGLARAGLRVVFFDGDNQANATSVMGLEPRDDLYALIAEDAEYRTLLRLVEPEFHGGAGELWLLSSSLRNIELEHNPTTPAAIVERVGELAGWADLVICDTGPGASDVHAGFFFAADWAVLPTLLEYTNILGVFRTLDYLAEARALGAARGLKTCEVLGILPNRLFVREQIQIENVGFLKGKYDGVYRVFPPIRNLTVWNQAAQSFRSIFNYRPDGDYEAQRKARAAASELQPVVDAALTAAGFAAASEAVAS